MEISQQAQGGVFYDILSSLI